MSTPQQKKAIDRAARRLVKLVREAGHTRYTTITTTVGCGVDEVVAVRLDAHAQRLHRAIQRIEKAEAKS